MTVDGAEPLLRLLTGQPLEVEPGLGAVPVLPPRAGVVAVRFRAARHELVLQVGPGSTHHLHLADRASQALNATGSTTAAIERATTTVDIARRLADAEPDHADYQRDLSVSYQRAAALAAGAGDINSARSRLSDAVALARTLAERSPEAAEPAVDLAFLLWQLGQYASGEHRDGHLHEAVELLTRLQADGRLPTRGRDILARLTGSSQDAEDEHAPSREV